MGPRSSRGPAAVNDIISKLVEGNKAAIALATEEYLEIHRICDEANVPREGHGEKLTAAQRVGRMFGMLCFHRLREARS